MIYFIILNLAMTVQRVFQMALFACLHVCMCASQACSRSHARLLDLFVQAKRYHHRSWLNLPVTSMVPRPWSGACSKPQMESPLVVGLCEQHRGQQRPG